MALAWVGFAATSAGAATTAAGPYYANPSWDQSLPSSTRFIVLSNMSSNAVLDRETGLVWERSPSTSIFNWSDAQFHCISLNAGNRGGWHLPTIQELRSLVDPTQSIPTLPAGHPFTGVQSFVYWSATSNATLTSGAWVVSFLSGVVGVVDKSSLEFARCVRGGQGVDPQ